MEKQKGAYAWTWVVLILFIIAIAGATYWLWRATINVSDLEIPGTPELEILRANNTNSKISSPKNTNSTVEKQGSEEGLLLYESPRGYSVEYPDNWKTYQGENSENFYIEWGPPTKEEISEATDRPGAEIFIHYLENNENLSPKAFAKDFIGAIESEIDIEEENLDIDGAGSFKTRYYSWQWPETDTFIPLEDHILKISVLERDFDGDDSVKKVYNQMISSFKFNEFTK